MVMGDIEALGEKLKRKEIMITETRKKTGMQESHKLVQISMKSILLCTDL